ncbi:MULTISPECIES: helix-turn-helix domain-containing protein [Rhodopseudomonas]|nr:MULTISPECIES: helix-turn-helix domain-containing protein [Rhodopseudomonas]
MPQQASKAMLTRYDAAFVRPRDRVAYLRDAVCASYVQLSCEITDPRDVRGAIEINHLSNLSVSEVSGSGGKVRRRPDDIRRASEEFFLLSLQLERAATVSQRGQTARLHPGDMAAYSSTEPYDLRMESDFRQLVLQIPKASLLLRVPNAELALGKRIDGASALGQLVGQSILRFGKHTADADATLNDQLADLLADLFATALTSVATGPIELKSSSRLLLLRAQAIIRHRFRDAEFDRIALAKSVGISVRRLNEIFATQQTSASEFIRETRLQMAAEELSDRRRSGLTVSDIAIRNGFGSFSHFSTAFRKRFEASPREWRRAGSHQVRKLRSTLD